MRHNQAHGQERRGFTLMEILVVVAVFSTVMLVATNVFLVATRSQRRTTQAQRVQGDVRFAIEAIAREVRFGTIDYDCYASTTCDPIVPGTINLQNAHGETTVLALRDLDGNRVRFRAFSLSGVNKLYICVINLADDPLTKCDATANWEPISPVGVQVAAARFYVYPFSDPYELSAAAVGSPFLADAQPRVTVVLRTQQSTPDVAPERVSLQTTVSSRVYLR